MPSPGLVEHFIRHMDADHAALRADLAGGDETVKPAAGADIDDPRARLQRSKRKRVCYAGK